MVELVVSEMARGTTTEPFQIFPQTVLALRGSHGVGIEAAMVGP